MLGMAFLLLQYMISAKAGLVNYVDGPTNVQLHAQVSEGSPVQTQTQGHVELLLTPGSFLRVGSNSQVVLDSVELNHVAVRVVDGTALVEVAEIDKHAPIQITTGGLSTIIESRGLYRFSDGTASVLEGKLRVVKSRLTVKKGHQITSTPNGDIAIALAITPDDDLDRWSQSRSSALATANAMAYNDRAAGTYSSVPYYPYWDIYSNRSAWIYSSLLSGFTFIPRGGYRSYYGYTFIPVTAFGTNPIFASRPGRTYGGTVAPVGPVRSGSPAGTPSRPGSIGSGIHAPSGGHPGGHGGGVRSGGHGHR